MLLKRLFTNKKRRIDECVINFITRNRFGFVRYNNILVRILECFGALGPHLKIDPHQRQAVLQL